MTKVGNSCPLLLGIIYPLLTRLPPSPRYDEKSGLLAVPLFVPVPPRSNDSGRSETAKHQGADRKCEQALFRWRGTRSVL